METRAREYARIAKQDHPDEHISKNVKLFVENYNKTWVLETAAMSFAWMFIIVAANLIFGAICIWCKSYRNTFYTFLIVTGYFYIMFGSVHAVVTQMHDQLAEQARMYYEADGVEPT